MWPRCLYGPLGAVLLRLAGIADSSTCKKLTYIAGCWLKNRTPEASLSAMQGSSPTGQRAAFSHTTCRSNYMAVVRRERGLLVPENSHNQHQYEEHTPPHSAPPRRAPGGGDAEHSWQGGHHESLKTRRCTKGCWAGLASI